MFHHVLAQISLYQIQRGIPQCHWAINKHSRPALLNKICTGVTVSCYFPCSAWNNLVASTKEREGKAAGNGVLCSSREQQGCGCQRGALIQAAHAVSALSCRTLSGGGEEEVIYICASDILIPSCTVSTERDTKSFRNVWLIIHLIKCSTLKTRDEHKALVCPATYPLPGMSFLMVSYVKRVGCLNIWSLPV